MITIAKPFSTSLQLASLRLPHLFTAESRRRQATLDLMHSSPHLLRDIGATENHLAGRQT